MACAEKAAEARHEPGRSEGQPAQMTISSPYAGVSASFEARGCLAIAGGLPHLQSLTGKSGIPA